MRLLIKLWCTESSPYEMQYHYHIQGFIYNLLKGSKYHFLHNKKGYKFFCFSNIFPVTSLIRYGDIRNLLISSPDANLIYILFAALAPLSASGSAVNVGNMKFKIDSVSELDVRIPVGESFGIITGTPIIIRVPKGGYKEYGIEPRKDYEYIYWRMEHPIEVFISQLRANLLKKYSDFYRLQNEFDWDGANDSFPLFQRFRFKKQISTKMIIKNYEQTVIGTLWDFEFKGWEYKNKDLLQFALDVGLGERNSLGFGFMNIKQ
jgi:CRISPR-associated endoribonuclease Cas6